MRASIAAVLLATACATPSLDGTWVCDERHEVDDTCWATVTLEESRDGTVVGVWSGEWGHSSLSAHRRRNELSGSVGNLLGGQDDFTAELRGDRLIFESSEERIVLRRVDSRDAGAPPAGLKRSR